MLKRIAKLHFLVVLVAGGLGGYLATLYAARQSGTNINLWSNGVLVDIPFGILAALVFVYLVSNTDREDLARLVSVALLAGLFWEPVVNGAGDQFVKKTSELAERQAFLELSEASQTLRQASSGQISDEEAAKEFGAKIELVDSLIPSIKTPNAREYIANELIQFSTTGNQDNQGWVPEVIFYSLQSESKDALFGDRLGQLNQISIMRMDPENLSPEELKLRDLTGLSPNDTSMNNNFDPFKIWMSPSALDAKEFGDILLQQRSFDK